jgi:hypothetical protein
MAISGTVVKKILNRRIITGCASIIKIKCQIFHSGYIMTKRQTQFKTTF